MLVTAVGLHSQKGAIMKLLTAADDDEPNLEKDGAINSTSKSKLPEPEKKTSVLEVKLKKFALKIGYIGEL